MLLQARIRLADRPGSLGRVTWNLGVLGADIRQVVVLCREGGRAVDDLTIDVPGAVSRERLISTLQEIPGVMVEGVWPASGVPGIATEVAVIGQVAADPSRGPAVLVDALPRLFGADWAALATAGGLVVYGSVAAPQEINIPEPVRARAYQDGERRHCAMAPFGEDPADQHVVVVSRTQAPWFHVAELDRLVQMVAATVTVLGGRMVDAEPGAVT
jgi:hypothetical protein